jgi:hypothetical protein
MGIRARLDYPSRMDKTLGYRFLPSPKRDRALPTALPAAPAAFALIYLHVFWRKRMAIAASTWYRAGAGCDRLTGVVGGEANHFGFGGSKARPRYQSTKCVRSGYLGDGLFRRHG